MFDKSLFWVHKGVPPAPRSTIYLDGLVSFRLVLPTYHTNKFREAKEGQARRIGCQTPRAIR
jgi:hypothetical protein